MKRCLSIVFCLLLAPALSLAQADQSIPNPVKSGPDSKDINNPTGAIVPTEKALEIEAPTAKEPEAEAATSSPSEPHLVGFHAGIGLPFLMGLGLDYVPPMNFLSFSADFGTFSQTVSDVKIGLSHFDVVARYHPFKGSFFLGLRAGSQTLNAEATETVTHSGNELTTKVKMEVKTNYITPHLGWQSNSKGFFIATDFGMQLPSSSSTSLTEDYGSADPAAITTVTNNADYQKAKKDATDAGDKFGKTSLPYWGMIRLGYYF